MSADQRPTITFLFAALLAFFVPGNSLVAQSLDFTLNATPAASMDLSDEWRIAKDPENAGKTAGWFRQGPVKAAVAAVVPNPLEMTFPGSTGGSLASFCVISTIRSRRTGRMSGCRPSSA